MNLRALVVDDEPLARQRIRHLLRRATDIDVAGECANGLEAVKAIEDLKPDLVFLDIQMPELDGFGVVEAVGAEAMPPTLFITAYDQHALRAFEVHALDYLLKPFSVERFHQALERARRWCVHQKDGTGPNLEALIDGLRQERPWVDRLLVKLGDRHVLVRTAAIQWIEAEDNYVRLHVEGTSHLLRQTMTGVLGRLDPAQFRRIHRSAIVNLDCIKEFQPWSGGDHLVIMRDGTKLTLSRTFRDQFGEWL
ncbi:MAG: response regulator transcription factor [Geothrix sp.]|jgi:two-component system LytT family response regulator|nr:response regulator transcription factor [Holophagaceae bacterium]MBK8788808.1 response regulator transcription factor [Holophagaceae bacterium]MBP7618791.1 response regulator transcription factor [Geothrix sp.]MCC6514359.1 response regulator transcription factor [Geothrix sp.]